MLIKNISLIAALMRNIRSESINRDMIGHKITRELGPITHEDIFSYAEATLDNPVRYRLKRCIAPPFYLSRLVYPLFRYFLVHKDLHLNLLRLVHGGQSVEWLGQFHEGDIITVEMSIGDITDSPAGEMIDFRTTVYVKGKPVAVSSTVFIVRRKGGRGSVKPAADREPAVQKEIFRRSFRTVENQQLKYAEVSGDGNFIHTNRFLARLAGLPGTIMHGVCIAAMAANCLLDEVLNGDMTRMEKISMRFASPVLPGEEITVIGYESGKSDTILFSAFNEKGRPVLKNGEYRFSA